MASNPQHEPTMEEILASIRKIISEDSNESAPNGQAHAQAAGAHVEADVLELTGDDVVEEAAHYVPEPPPVQESARVMQMPTPVKHEVEVPHPVVEEYPVSPTVNAAASNDVHSEAREGFFSESTRKAMHETFARLDAEPEVEHIRTASAPASAPEGATVQAVFEHAVRENFGPVVAEYLHTNVDAIVERMKPLVREWMDEHFPAILEGAVRNEVERAVKAAAASKAPRR